MTRVFVLTNHKGGVGKSSSATNIALGIAGVLRRAGAANSRVLLIDTDSQGHATLVTTGRRQPVCGSSGGSRQCRTDPLAVYRPVRLG
jgi:cellulose biosynthesis protein BcsQ